MEEKGSGGVGVELIKELTRDLNDYLERKDYASIEEFRGVARGALSNIQCAPEERHL